MASKGLVILGRISIWLTVIIVLIISALACYASVCNMRATLFNNLEQRETLTNLYGCMYWGCPLFIFAVVSGISLTALLIMADIRVKNKITTEGYEPITEE